MKHKNSGFTLIELMIVIAIIGILLALAGPSFTRMMARSELQTIISEWRNSFFLAQKEAIRSKHRVILCPSINGKTCAADSTNFSVGWIVLDNESGRLIQDFAPTTSLQKDIIDLKLNIAKGARLEFLRNGRLPSNFAGGNVEVSFSAKHQKVTDVGSTLKITRAGRIRSE